MKLSEVYLFICVAIFMVMISHINLVSGQINIMQSTEIWNGIQGVDHVTVGRIEDKQSGVTCWLASNSNAATAVSIACLPTKYIIH